MNQELTMKKVAFGLHVPKCAGSTILNSVERKLNPVEYYQSTALIKNFWGNSLELHEYNNIELIKFVFGHHIYDEMLKLFDEVFLFTFLRDPIDRAVSNYRYLNRLNSQLGHKPLDIDDFFSTYPSMCDFIIERFPQFILDPTVSKSLQAESILSKFDFVGSSSDVATILTTLEKYLEIDGIEIKDANVAPKDKNASDEIEHVIEKSKVYFRDDVELYERFIALSRKSPNPHNPFSKEDALMWRKNNFQNSKFDFSIIKDRVVKEIYWEYTNHNVLDKYISKIQDKLEFYNSMMMFHNKIQAKNSKNV